MVRTVLLGLALSSSLALPCFAGPIPQELQGRWSDGRCNAENHILELSANQLNITQGGNSLAAATVDAQGKAATGVRLRFTRIIRQMNPAAAHAGDSFVVRVNEGKLTFVERVIGGKRETGSNDVLSRCPE